MAGINQFQKGGFMRKLFVVASLCFIATISVGTLLANAAETLKIGMIAPSTGTFAESGRYEVWGAKLAAEEINKAGGVLGRQIELVVEDDQTTNPGAVMAFSKLAGNKDIHVFISTVLSTQIKSIAPDVLKVAKPVMIGGTDPTLTHMGNPWLFRFRPNDTYSARVIADFGVKKLGKKKWAIVYSTDTFGTSGKDSLVADLKSMGIEPILVQGYANNAPDFTPIALALKKSGADVMVTYFSIAPDLGIFAKQIRQLGVNIPWIGSASTATITARRLAGPALNGVYAVVDFHPNSSPASRSYSDEYQAAYKTSADFLSAWSYDAVHAIALAINDAKSTDPEKIRQAILKIRNYNGAQGTYNFDRNGDGLHGYNLVKIENGEPSYVGHIDFPD
jgi:branched-chain amino acid transport system substrate-binding protein